MDSPPTPMPHRRSTSTPRSADSLDESRSLHCDVFGLHFRANFRSALAQRLRFCFVAHRFVNFGEMIQTGGGFGMFRATRFLCNVNRAPSVRFRFLVIALLAIKIAQIVQSCAGFVMIWSKLFFKKRERFLIERLGFVVLSEAGIDR